MENEGFGNPAANAAGATTTQPERALETGDPNLFGAAAPEEKKGIKGRVKGLLGRHGRKKDAQKPAGMAGKAKEKLAHQMGHGEDGEKHGPARLLSMSSSSSSMSSSDEEDIGTVGFALDPTGPAVAGRNLGRRDFNSAPAGPGADFSKLDLKPPVTAATERHAKRAEEFAKWSTPWIPKNEDAPGDERNHPSPASNSFGSGDRTRGDEHHLSPRSNSNRSGREDASSGGVDYSHSSEAGNPSEDHAYGGPHSEVGVAEQTATDDGEPRSSAPVGTTKAASGAEVGYQHEGPRDENAKPEGFMSKVMDTFRSPKGESAGTSTTSTD